ncbi:MAG: XdhC family protein [Gemmataceae bacterium]|nr:XdhC family protein [Gemmataceae bacterium]
MRDLLAELNRCLDQGRACVYCAVVETRGSTPQKAGAAMLVFPDGTQTGTLGGGCVEAEVKQRALRVFGDPAAQPEVLTFNLDDNYGWDDGLICGGRMTILADPLTPASAAGAAEKGYYRRYRDLAEQGTGGTEAVVVNAQTSGAPVGSRYLFDSQGCPVAQLANAPPTDGIIHRLTPVQQRPRPSLQHGVAYLPILPRITLLVVGGGHVGQAVARLAADVDFEIWALDDRERYVNRDRFPTARRLLIGDIGVTLKELARDDITPSVYGIIVTRGHAHDEEALFHLATTSAGYVGMIGSKRKIKLIYEDLRARDIPESALARVHAPLGLDIGSQTVPEIAISIVAELIARRNLDAVEYQSRFGRDQTQGMPSHAGRL